MPAAIIKNRDELVDFNELMELCRAGRSTVKRAIKEGRFPLKPVQKPRVPHLWLKADVIEWLKTNTVIQPRQRIYENIVVGDEKRCAKCKTWKKTTDFYPDKNSSLGLSSYCAECTKEYNSTRPYRKQRSEYSKEYNQRPSVRVRITNRKSKNYSTPSGRARILCQAAKNHRAKRKGISYSLDENLIALRIGAGFCERTGLPFDIISAAQPGGNPLAPSLDRVNSSDSYSMENIQVVSLIYNLGKNLFDDTTFIAMCVAVAERYAGDPQVQNRLKELRDAKF